MTAAAVIIQLGVKGHGPADFGDSDRDSDGVTVCHAGRHSAGLVRPPGSESASDPSALLRR